LRMCLGTTPFVSAWNSASVRAGRFAFPRKLNGSTPPEPERPGRWRGTGNLEEMAWYANNSGRQHLDAAKLWDADTNSYFQHLADNGCGTHTVATAKPNDWGLYDMQGNVLEWVADWFSEDYFHDDVAGVDPHGPAQSTLGSRVMRGGSWGSDPRNCRLAHRDWNVPSTQTGSCGFRIVMDSQ
jgi:formylglycine-generating enzyme required for sulfatase activity